MLTTTTMDGPFVRRHAEKRGSQRKGLSRAAVRRLALQALERGHPPDHFRRFFRRWLQSRENAKVLVHNGDVFIFNERDQLITLYEIPKHLVKYAILKEPPQ